MDNATALARIKNQLTGGGHVKLEVEDVAIDGFIDEAFGKVVGWYLEPRIAETVAVTGGGTKSQIILKSTLSRPIRILYRIYDTETTGFASTLEAELLNLEGDVLPDEAGIASLTYQVEYAKMLENFLKTGIEFFETSTKILISGNILRPNVTVVYHPQPVNLSEVTVPRAYNWAFEWAMARTKEALGRVRSKFRSGDLNLETDGVDLITSSETRIEILELALETIDFRHTR